MPRTRNDGNSPPLLISAGRNGRRSDTSYGWLSTRPLHVLVFLIPLMVLYEVGSVVYLSDPSRGVMETIGARRILMDFFQAFGAASLHLPPIALAVVLLMWHIFERDPWRLRAPVLGIMLAESFLWSLPLLVLGLILGVELNMVAAGAPLSERTWQARLTLSFGAGIYEELLFRLILVTAVHFVVVDLLKLSQGSGFVAAAVISALAFALYHDVSKPMGGTDWSKLLFFSLAGLYFASVFILRGFGVVVVTHAIYDAVVLLAVSQPPGAAQPS